MIDQYEMYKVRYINLETEQTDWIKAFKHSPVIGGNGKMFSSKTQVNIMFKKLQRHKDFGKKFKCEIVTYKLTESSFSRSPLK